jgi:hypothetical protein
VEKVYNEVAENYGTSYYHEWAQAGVPRLLWKRGSKLGIEIIARNNGPHLHFVLDGLEIEPIVNKSAVGGQSVTASELRYAYRNRDRLEGKIHFYRDKQEVSAPWVENAALWSGYKPKSAGKYSDSGSGSGGHLADKSSASSKFSRFKASIRNAFGRN